MNSKKRARPRTGVNVVVEYIVYIQYNYIRTLRRPGRPSDLAPGPILRPSQDREDGPRGVDRELALDREASADRAPSPPLEAQ